jgi:arylsulfatase A-like enzyme
MNIIVIVADSFRRDHLGCYGNEWINTPNLDTFAAGACVIEGAYADSLNTMPARTSMWTGRIGFPFRGWQPLEVADLTIAEWLWDKGYHSGYITDVYHMHKPGYNCGRGFDSTVFIRGQEYDPWIVDETIDVEGAFAAHFKPSPHNDKAEMWGERFRQYLRNITVRQSEEDYCVAQVMNAGIRWLEQRQGRDDLFLWVDCFDPHEPWDPPAEFKEQYNPGYQGREIIDPVPSQVEGYLTSDEMTNIKALYAGEISFVDKWIGRLLDAAREMGYFENSMIVFTSDHGEPLDDHGIVRKHKPWMYEEHAAVPMIIHTPDGAGAGERRQALVQSCDIAPTICEAAGVDPQPRTHGKSMLPLVRGEVGSLRDTALTGIHNQSWNIRDERWSFLMAFDRERELYDRLADPTEQNNVIAEHPDVASAMELDLRRQVADLRWE